MTVWDAGETDSEKSGVAPPVTVTLAVPVFPLVFIMAQVGSMEFPVQSWTDMRVRNAWLLLHIFWLVGFRNRIAVMSEWAWAYLTYRGARLITGKVEPLMKDE